MDISNTPTPDGGEVTIRITGRFSFDASRRFRDAYRGYRPDARYIVDLSAVESMDSAALGMLLLLREHAGGDGSRIELRGANPEIGRVLKTVGMNDLFTIV